MLCAVEKRRSPDRCERSGVRKKPATLNRVFRKDLTEMVREEKRHEGTIRGSHVAILQRRNSRYTGPKVGVYKVCSMISRRSFWVDQSDGLQGGKKGALFFLLGPQRSS